MQKWINKELHKSFTDGVYKVTPSGIRLVKRVNNAQTVVIQGNKEDLIENLRAFRMLLGFQGHLLHIVKDTFYIARDKKDCDVVYESIKDGVVEWVK